jgi:hypothetical protein
VSVALQQPWRSAPGVEFFGFKFSRLKVQNFPVRALRLYILHLRAVEGFPTVVTVQAQALRNQIKERGKGLRTIPDLTFRHWLTAVTLTIRFGVTK